MPTLISFEPSAWAEGTFMTCMLGSRNITTIVIALLLDTYLTELHHCSNTSVCLCHPYVYYREFCCIHFYFHIVFLVLWHVYKYLCVCLLDAFQKARMYCIFCLCPLSFLSGQSLMIIAQDQKEKKKKKKKHKINLGCRLRANLCKTLWSSLAYFIPFSLFEESMTLNRCVHINRCADETVTSVQAALQSIIPPRLFLLGARTNSSQEIVALRNLCCVVSKPWPTQGPRRW